MMDAIFLAALALTLAVFMYDHRERTRKQREMLDSAWMLIANVGRGDWTGQEREWQAAAHWWGVMGGYRATTPTTWPRTSEEARGA